MKKGVLLFQDGDLCSCNSKLQLFCVEYFALSETNLLMDISRCVAEQADGIGNIMDFLHSFLSLLPRVNSLSALLWLWCLHSDGQL